MSSKGTTITLDKQKGLVYIRQTEDSLIHFCRKDRTSGTVEDDFIIFPNDCEFKHVPQCPSRKVSVLKFKAESKRLFFWMQEPKTHQDEEHCQEVNEYLNNHPHMPGALGASGSGGHKPSALGEEIQSTLSSPQFQQALDMFSVALDSGQLGPLMCQFGLPAEAVEATNKGDVEAFSKGRRR
ncbi:Proteasomal ubiquitin receptor ADRM1 [Sciurus carolinensis]|uniref:Proteasomal ubiquitin receptor ADRM1 n=1 Tax=Sciurus carolinensis TaxID=30640 RepID=A0AA41MTZ0_SCICA|nr:Proteasomal ubiquitin receptor ADRM1 [Sciurus carolinensis]